MLIDDVETIIRLKPGLKASQIAAEIFGEAGYPERVNALLRVLCRVGRIERRGSGGPGDPYTYHPVAADCGEADGEAEVSKNERPPKRLSRC
jgi:hypothetical protein